MTSLLRHRDLHFRLYRRRLRAAAAIQPPLPRPRAATTALLQNYFRLCQLKQHAGTVGHSCRRQKRHLPPLSVDFLVRRHRPESAAFYIPPPLGYFRFRCRWRSVSKRRWSSTVRVCNRWARLPGCCRCHEVPQPALSVLLLPCALSHRLPFPPPTTSGSSTWPEVVTDCRTGRRRSGTHSLLRRATAEDRRTLSKSEDLGSRTRLSRRRHFYHAGILLSAAQHLSPSTTSPPPTMTTSSLNWIRSRAPSTTTSSENCPWPPRDRELAAEPEDEEEVTWRMTSLDDIASDVIVDVINVQIKIKKTLKT